MKNRRGGLGRGLGALIPTGLTDAAPAVVPDQPAAPVEPAAAPTAPPPAAAAPAPAPTPVPAQAAPSPDEDTLAPVPGARFREIPVHAIEANAKQPRQVFDEEALEELKTSIDQVGFLQPIVVRELSAGAYELVMGERRWRAAQALGRETIPAIIRDTRDDDMLRDALLENIHRANLNPLEEAAAYQQLLEEFGATHEELAKRIGRSRPQISNTIRLLNLPPTVQSRVAAGVLSAGHARALLGLTDATRQLDLAKRIVAEGLSVRATEEIVNLTDEDEPKAKAPAARKAKPHAPALSELADRLSDKFDTRVKVDLGRRKGRIVVEFATVDDLERIVGVMGIAGRADD
ncbi:ParB/RepB/Spo0J family partition protein [Actinocatenispora rupis]|uniref:Chromosome partitioning protein ParB n=1 Tax=Actinocatenispora rupis TaxID=519421 RepID=A0A8J3JEA0_9ACTN|nr:ParB/RepB/Spo0J family partition protein [Actinocatenispora rupis]GID13248.1 chromosome partitioning protein ParB [Actinocatenispora rupis]